MAHPDCLAAWLVGVAEFWRSQGLPFEPAEQDRALATSLAISTVSEVASILLLTPGYAVEGEEYGAWYRWKTGDPPFHTVRDLMTSLREHPLRLYTGREPWRPWGEWDPGRPYGP